MSSLGTQRALTEVNPDFSLEHLRRVIPFRNPATLDRLAEGRRKAGWID
jgi:adenylate cyclase